MSTPIDDKLPSKRFGEKLRTLREQRNMSQRQLGALVDVSQGHIYRMENGLRNPNLAMLLKLSEIFEVSIDVMVKDQLELDT